MGKKKLVLDGGLSCPKCGKRMQRYAHLSEWRPKLHQPYYFSHWDYCRRCQHVQHYEAAKIWVDPPPDAEAGCRLAAIREQLGET